MFDFLTASENLPFAVALGVMLGIAILEGLTALLGVALSGLIDAMLPDDLFGVPDSLSGPDLDSQTALSRVLGWLRVGEVPVLMLLVIFLTAFGLVGLALQSFVVELTGGLLPAVVVAAPAFFAALPVVRLFGGILQRVMPKDETDAVSGESLVGRLATLTLGEARVGRPAEARVRDIRGTTHYVMVEPDDPAELFTSHAVVLLVRQEGHIFKAITNTHAALKDDAVEGE